MKSVRAGVLLAPGFEEIEAITPIDLLHRGGVEVTLVGVSERDVTGAHGVTVKTDALINEVAWEDYDAVILPGGMPGSKNLAESPEVQDLLVNMHQKKRVIAAICAAPALVLAPLGILDGRNAVCFPGLEKQAPQVAFLDQDTAVDDHVVTGRGAGKSGSFALEILALLKGRSIADEVGTRSLYL